MDMLENSSLFFARIDRVGDPLEGSITKADDIFFEERYRTSVRKAAKSFTKGSLLPRTFVNCWHASEHESAAMWKIHADRAIAIRSSYERLESCLKIAEITVGAEAYLGRIRYLDYQKDRGPESFVSRVMCKRKSFDHERELRAVVTLNETRKEDLPESGVSVLVDLKGLVEAVHVAPGSPDWFRNLVQQVLRNRYSLGVPILRSSMDDEAIY
jgi:hypothetical protein